MMGLGKGGLRLKILPMFCIYVGFLECKWSGARLFTNHEKAIWKGSHNPSNFGDETDHQGYSMMISNWDDPPSTLP